MLESNSLNDKVPNEVRGRIVQQYDLPSTHQGGETYFFSHSRKTHQSE